MLFHTRHYFPAIPFHYNEDCVKHFFKKSSFFIQTRKKAAVQSFLHSEQQHSFHSMLMLIYAVPPHQSCICHLICLTFLPLSRNQNQLLSSIPYVLFSCFSTFLTYPSTVSALNASSFGVKRTVNAIDFLSAAICLPSYTSNRVTSLT